MSSKYLSELMNLPVQTNMRLMPATVNPSDPVSIVIDKMVRENIGAVIVVEGGIPSGIVTERDILERVVKPLRSLQTTLARDVMSQPLITIEAESSMKDTLDLMHRHNIRRLPVTKDGALIGLITERRLLEVAFMVA